MVAYEELESMGFASQKLIILCGVSICTELAHILICIYIRAHTVINSKSDGSSEKGEIVLR